MQKTILTMLLAICCSVMAPGGSVFAADQGEKEDPENQAFEQSLENQFAMTPDQIEKFKQRMQDTQRAMRKKSPPEMTNRTRRLTFQTGEKPPVLRIAPGYVTTISFFDSTGQPWPVTSATLGNPNYYSVQRPENQSNVITIAAQEEYVDSNLALTFEEQNVPATIQLKTVSEDEADAGGSETDSLVVFRAEQRGPNADEPTIGPEPEETVGSTMMSFLDNVPPDSAEQIGLKAESGGRDEGPDDIALWSLDDSLYLRTKHSLLWPSWSRIVKGPGGVRVYKLSQVSSLMVSRGGNSVTYEVGEKLYAK